jgi:O-antigen/teichoic acid export membrane protein
MSGPAAEPAGKRPSETATFSGGIATTLAGKFSGRAFQFAGQVFLARLLGPEGFGLYALGWAVFGMTRVMAPLGLDYAVMRFGGRYWGRDASAFRSILRRSLTLALVSSGALGLLLLLAAGPLANGFFTEPRATTLLRLFAFALPMAALVRVSSAATRVRQRMASSILAEDLVQPAVALGLTVLLIPALRGDPQGAAIAAVATVVSFGVALAVALALLRRAFPDLAASGATAGPDVRALVSFAVPSAIASSLGVVILLVDRAVIGHYCPVEDVGRYQAIAQTSMLFIVVQNAINTVFSSFVPAVEGAARRERLLALLRTSTKWGLYLSAPAALLFLVLPGETIQVLFGVAYSSGDTALRLLTLAQVLSVAAGPVGLLLILTGFQREWLAVTATVFVANVGLNVVLVPAFGLEGAATATLLSTALLLVVGGGIARARLGGWGLQRRLFKGAAAAAAAAAALVGVRALSLSPVLAVATGAVAVTTVFAAVLVTLGLDEEDRSLLREIRDRTSRLQRSS